MTTPIHIDLETLDTKHTAKILSIGACTHDSTLYVEVDQESYDELEVPVFTESQSTLDWWEEQGGFKPQAKAQLPVVKALQTLADFIAIYRSGESDEIEVWANAPTFDCAILRYHFDVYNMPVPWKFYEERDVRTIRSLSRDIGLGIDKPPAPHHALKDAHNQMVMVDKVYSTLIQRIKQANDAAFLRTYKQETSQEGA